MNTGNGGKDEVAIRRLIDQWATAVRAKDFEGILAHHSADVLMFDVPPPFESKGIEAYRKTWDLFFSMAPDPVAFEIERLDVVAGAEVAFAAALMRCAEPGNGGEWIKLEFRLSIGLRKIAGQWTIVHEHHSVPAV
jgi:uncharacterized protein (TIGR02246 family)